MATDSITKFTLQRSSDGSTGPWTTIAEITDSTSTTENHTTPNTGQTITIVVANASWIDIGEYINVANDGLYKVTGKVGNSLSCQYVNANYNSHSGEVVPLGAQVLPGSYVDALAPSPTLWYRIIADTVNGTIITYNVMSVTQQVSEGQLIWVRTWAGPQSDTCYAVSAAPGNQFVVSSQDSAPMGVKRYDANGNLIWRWDPLFGGSQFGLANCTDPSGNVYVTGYSIGPMFLSAPDAPFAPIPPMGSGGDHLVIIKLNSIGQPVWGQYLGPYEGSSSYGNGIAYFEQAGVGYLWVVGNCTGTVNFGGSNKTALQNQCPMIFKLRADTGAFTGVGEIYGLPFINGLSWAQGVTVDSNGGPIMVGKAGGSPTAGGVNFGNGTATLKPTDQDGTVGFIVRFNSSLAAQWSKQTGVGFREDIVYAVARNPATDEIYIGGAYRGPFDLGNGVTLPVQRSIEFYSDAFIAKLQGNGTALWARAFGSDIGVNDSCYAVAVAHNGDVLCGGNISLAIDWGEGEKPGSGANGWIARYSPDNVFRWVRRIAGGSTNAVRGIAVDATDSAIAVGSFTTNLGNGPVDFGDGVPFGGTGPSTGSDAFIARYSA